MVEPLGIQRGTTGVVLPQSLSGEIWTKVQESSAALAFSGSVDLPGTGATVEVILTDPEPDWVGETDEAKVSRGTVTSKNMTPYSMSVIVPFSKKFRRDKGALYAAMVDRLPGAIAKKVDATIFHGASPGTNFDVLTGAGAVSLLTVTGPPAYDAYDALVEVETLIGEVDDGGAELSGIVLSPRGKALLRGVKDANGMPKFYGDLQSGALTSVNGFPLRSSRGVYKAGVAGAPGTPAMLGVAGDWSYARHGIVEDITVSMSDQATITDGATTLNLWQRGMFALKVDVELGFVVRDLAAFKRLTGAVPTA